MDFLSILNEQLDNIDLFLKAQEINSLEYQRYFMSKSGQEHYRLLTYISQSENDLNILDVGTLKGCSALAFSTNETNRVFSFNISNELDLKNTPTNCEFIVDNILNGNYIDVILNSKYIMLDTYHDGGFETEFFNYLKEIGYKGYLLLDDIKLNQKMIDFWNYIDIEKTDISHLGHITGTGVVYFK